MTWPKNIARITNDVHCHSRLSGNKYRHEFRFSILRIVISALCRKTILQTCDNWDTDYNSYNWEPEFMTIFVTWQSLDSIRNSCDVFFNTSYFWGRTENFKVCWLWAAITPVKKLARPKSTTFSETSGPELSHGPILEKFSHQKISRRRVFSKNAFFAIFHCRPPKNF